MLLAAICIFYSSSAFYVSWYCDYYTNQSVIEKLKNLNALSSPTSKEDFLRNLNTMKTLAMNGKLTEFEIDRLLELLNTLTI